MVSSVVDLPHMDAVAEMKADPREGAGHKFLEKIEF